MHTVSLSDSEWKLMNQLWHTPPYTITQLVALFKQDTGWSKHTIISMLNRLETKGAVGYEAGGRAKLFYPIIDREQAQIKETQGFLSRLYGGSLGLPKRAFQRQRSTSCTKY